MEDKSPKWRIHLEADKMSGQVFRGIHSKSKNYLLLRGIDGDVRENAANTESRAADGRSWIRIRWSLWMERWESSWRRGNGVIALQMSISWPLAIRTCSCVIDLFNVSKSISRSEQWLRSLIDDGGLRCELRELWLDLAREGRSSELRHESANMRARYRERRDVVVVNVECEDTAQLGMMSYNL